MVWVLSNAGDQVPLIPFIDNVESAGIDDPIQIGVTAANVGMVN